MEVEIDWGWVGRAESLNPLYIEGSNDEACASVPSALDGTLHPKNLQTILIKHIRNDGLLLRLPRRLILQISLS